MWEKDHKKVLELVKWTIEMEFYYVGILLKD